MKNFNLLDVVSIAEEASKLIMNFYQSGDFEVKIKSDKSPVTEADLQSSSLIVKRLEEISDYPVLSEEKVVDYQIRKDWNFFWLVDPLDGTKDFIKRTGDFTVNIALIENHKPVLGVVAIPAQNLVYFAKEGEGARCKSSKGVEKISASLGHEPLRCAVSRFHCSAETEAFCERNGIKEKVGYGSALKMCKIAEGEVDIYPRLSPTMEWDTAAGHAIMNEAGGKIVSAVNYEPLQYNKESLYNDPFIASRVDLDLK